jgi:hypothetical protein
LDDPVQKPGGGPITDPRRVEWRRPLDADYWRRPVRRAIPDRWMSVTDHAGHRARGNDTAGGRLPSASGSGDVCRECTTRDRGRGLRWARSTDADGEGEVRGLSGHGICTGPLDFPHLIDGSCPFDIPSPSRAGSMSPSGGRGGRWPTPVKHELSISREVKGERRLGSQEQSRLCSGTRFVSGTRATRRLRLRSPSSRPPPLPRPPWRADRGATLLPLSRRRLKFH